MTDQVHLTVSQCLAASFITALATWMLRDMICALKAMSVLSARTTSFVTEEVEVTYSVGTIPSVAR